MNLSSPLTFDRLLLLQVLVTQESRLLRLLSAPYRLSFTTSQTRRLVTTNTLVLSTRFSSIRTRNGMARIRADALRRLGRTSSLQFIYNLSSNVMFQGNFILHFERQLLEIRPSCTRGHVPYPPEILHTGSVTEPT